MTQSNEIMSMGSRLDRVENEQANVREHMNRLIDSQEKQTAELSKQNEKMSENTAALMLVCHRLEESSETGKLALEKANQLSERQTIMETKWSESVRNQKVIFAGMFFMTLAAAVGLFNYISKIPSGGS